MHALLKSSKHPVLIWSATRSRSLTSIIIASPIQIDYAKEMASSRTNRAPVKKSRSSSPGKKTSIAAVSLVRRSKPRTSQVFDSYWRFAHERQEVYFKRIETESQPWTNDPIIQSYRFTNVYRSSDRVSQFLIRNVIYDSRKSRSKSDTLFRILIFKFFNRIDTWKLLSESLGEIRWSTYSYRDYDTVLTQAMEARQRIYSAAYIMPACGVLASGRKHRGHLRLIEKMMRNNLVQELGTASTMAEAFAMLRSYPMLGDFLALQFLIDINYSELTDFSEDDFIVPGPGARDGLRKVFVDPGEYSETDLIRWVADRQESQFSRLGLAFKTIWGRRLHLIDCQNLFCEVSKYARVRHPEVTGISGRTRIKQRFTSDELMPRPWFPPKWKLNPLITQTFSSTSIAKN